MRYRPRQRRGAVQGMQKGRLRQRTFRAIQLRIPIACVDVLPVREGIASGKEVGLIFRETPNQGRRWCLIGGRLLINESFRTAIIREVTGALGEKVQCAVNDPLQPMYVAEYFSQKRKGKLYDPRQHAIGLTFQVQIKGKIDPRGETLKYQWFDVREIPRPADFGFGQYKVVHDFIKRLQTVSVAATK
jgi:ADP-ribose pyrophosphatase YjhB (NUDIX family)